MVFSIEKLRPIREGMTISRDSKLGDLTKVTYFSLGKDTSISQEIYDRMTMYIGASGWGEFIIGEAKKKFHYILMKQLLSHHILYVVCRHQKDWCIQN